MTLHAGSPAHTVYCDRCKLTTSIPIEEYQPKRLQAYLGKLLEKHTECPIRGSQEGLNK